MKLSELVKIIGSNLTVTRTFDNRTGKWSNYLATFENLVEFKTYKESGVLSSVSGIGKTEKSALRDLVTEINKYKIAILNAYSENRKEIEFPSITLSI